jgi:hypothetical protein
MSSCSQNTELSDKGKCLPTIGCSILGVFIYSLCFQIQSNSRPHASCLMQEREYSLHRSWKLYQDLNFKRYAIKTYLRSGGIATRINNLFIRRRVVSFTLRPLYSRGKSPRHTLHKRLGGSQSSSGS